MKQLSFVMDKDVTNCVNIYTLNQNGRTVRIRKRRPLQPDFFRGDESRYTYRTYCLEQLQRREVYQELVNIHRRTK